MAITIKKTKIAILLSILLIGGVVFVLLWVNLQERRKALEKEENFSRISAEGVEQRLEKIRFVEEKEGKKTWELEAKAISQYQDQNIMVLEDVKVTYYSKDGRSFVITGDQGKVYQNSKDVELTGNILCTSSDGYRFKTHSISYQHSEKKMTTSDRIELEGEQLRLTGIGMWVDMESKSFKVLGDVKTQWKGGGKG